METKNVIAAIALSSAVIVLYSLFFIPEKPSTKQNLTEKEKIEKNTPIFEAQTSNNLGLKYRLLSMSSQVETQLPSLVNSSTGNISTDTSTLVQKSANSASETVQMIQKIGTGTSSNTSGITVPIDIQESVFSIRASSRFLTISDSGGNPLPISYISQRDQMALYRKTATSGTTGNPSLQIQIRPKASLNETIYCFSNQLFDFNQP